CASGKRQLDLDYW
nr:immunoglobulin heavy chain junction region [Macaca mulatta]